MSETGDDLGDIFARVSELRRQLGEHPGKLAAARRDEIFRSYDVFVRNLRELYGLVVTAETDERIAIELIQNVRPPKMREAFYGQLDQRLQNTLSSAVALVDHTRRLLRFYSDTHFATEFNERNSTLRSNPVARFLRDLRNYLLHYGMAPFEHTLTIGKTIDDSKVLLNSSGLLLWSGWSSASKDYINASGGAIQLRLAVEEYGRQMQELYKWMFAQIDEIDQADVDAANSIVAQINLTLTGGRTDNRNFDMAPSAEDIRRFRESQEQASSNVDPNSEG